MVTTCCGGYGNQTGCGDCFTMYTYTKTASYYMSKYKKFLSIILK